MMIPLARVLKLQAHLAAQRENAFRAGDAVGEAVLGRVLADLDTAVLKDNAMAKMTVGQVLNIALIVQHFVSSVQSGWASAKTPAARKAVIVQAVRDVLPAIEAIVGKDLLDNAKVNAAITALVDAAVRAPDRKD